MEGMVLLLIYFQVSFSSLMIRSAMSFVFVLRKSPGMLLVTHKASDLSWNWEKVTPKLLGGQGPSLLESLLSGGLKRPSLQSSHLGQDGGPAALASPSQEWQLSLWSHSRALWPRTDLMRVLEMLQPGSHTLPGYVVQAVLHLLTGEY